MDIRILFEVDKNYEVIISNMNQVKEIAKKFKFNCDYIRPTNLSEDDTSMYETVFDLINWYEEIYDEVVEKITYCNHRIHSGCANIQKIINRGRM